MFKPKSQKKLGKLRFWMLKSFRDNVKSVQHGLIVSKFGLGYIILSHG